MDKSQILEAQFPDHPDQKRLPDPLLGLFGISTPYVFLLFSVLSLFAFDGAWTWFFSGTTALLFLILLGPHGNQVRSPISVWSLFIGINTFYAFISTSWLALYFYIVGAWTVVFILSIAQSNRAQRYVRRNLRRLSRDLHWFQDRIACFRLPALEIDVDVSGLMVVRGITFCLSKFALEVHGIEVAIKLADNMEIAIQTEKVMIRLGRSIEIGDVYGNFKTDSDTGPGSHPEGHALKYTNTIQQMTNGQVEPKKIESTTISDVVDELKGATDVVYPEDEEEEAEAIYKERIQAIDKSSTVNAARDNLTKAEKLQNKDFSQKEKKAFMSSFLHYQPSIPHPPEYSISVSKLQSLTPPWLHRLNQRVPVGLRLLLQAVSYLHPVKINGIIATGSGKFISATLKQEVFKHYPDGSTDIAKLATRIETWLETGNFVAEISKINGLAQVPLTTVYDITASLKTSTIQVFKVLTAENEYDAEGEEEDRKSINLTIRDKEGIKKEEEKGISECLRLDGVSASFDIPTMLIPHHEYLFPPPPAEKHKSQEKWLEPVESDVMEPAKGFENDRIESDSLQDDFNGAPAKTVEEPEKDEVYVDMSLLVSLPAQFNSTLLHFISAVVKAGKLIDMEKNSTSIKDTLKRSVVATVASDAWIAKMVNKITTAMEGLKGDLGYKMPIPVPLQPRRELLANNPLYKGLV